MAEHLVSRPDLLLGQVAPITVSSKRQVDGGGGYSGMRKDI